VIIFISKEFSRFKWLRGKLKIGGKVSPDGAQICANLRIYLFVDRIDRQESDDGTRYKLPGSGGTFDL